MTFELMQSLSSLRRNASASLNRLFRMVNATTDAYTTPMQSCRVDFLHLECKQTTIMKDDQSR